MESLSEKALRNEEESGMVATSSRRKFFIGYFYVEGSFLLAALVVLPVVRGFLLQK